MPHKAFFSLSLYGTSWNRVFDLANRDVCWGGAICSLKRETRLSARNTEIKKPGHFFTSNRVKIIFIF
ncbi:hypothetical protein B6R23_26545 [Escherichia coli]|nr:hypothetical protein [Escherichia coli]EFO2581332.1 hypothetical protein [Escherichia coli]EFO2628896.1 hypothetical protein [Escherichia coli]EFO3875121.1 hypothetical protein [Escherichia coli]